MRRILLVLCVIAAIVAAVAAFNGLVDPEDEFYSGEALSAALASNCLLAYDVTSRSYPELKQDLFRRKHPTRVVLSSDGAARPGLELGFPGFAPDDVLAMLRYLTQAVPDGRKLRVAVVTQPSWFDARALDGASGGSALVEARLPRQPEDARLVARSHAPLGDARLHRLAEGARRSPLRRRPAARRHTAFRLDGTFYAPESRVASGEFAWERLTPVDDALALAKRRGWRVAGISTLPGSEGLPPRAEGALRQARLPVAHS